MKKVLLKTIDGLHPSGAPIELNYLSQMILVMRTPMDGRTAGIDEVHKSIRVLDVLENTTGDFFELEDADYDYLKQKVRAFKWPFVDRAVEQFVEDISNAWKEGKEDQDAST